MYLRSTRISSISISNNNKIHIRNTINISLSLRLRHNHTTPHLALTPTKVAPHISSRTIFHTHHDHHNSPLLTTLHKLPRHRTTPHPTQISPRTAHHLKPSLKRKRSTSPRPKRLRGTTGLC
jgi:hypothetical protein